MTRCFRHIGWRRRFGHWCSGDLTRHRRSNWCCGSSNDRRFNNRRRGFFRYFFCGGFSHRLGNHCRLCRLHLLNHCFQPRYDLPQQAVAADPLPGFPITSGCVVSTTTGSGASTGVCGSAITGSTVSASAVSTGAGASTTSVGWLETSCASAMAGRDPALSGAIQLHFAILNLLLVLRARNRVADPHFTWKPFPAMRRQRLKA